MAQDVKKLFFELLQVSMGTLECVERGPSPEEWNTFYEWAKTQQVEGVGYHGVERLFEFGLRTPQDVSIDWMSEAEMIREQNQQTKQPRVAQYYPETLRDLRQRSAADDGTSQTLDVQQLYRLSQQGRLNIRLLMDYCYVLRVTKGRYEKLKAGGMGALLLGTVGQRRFARGLTWLLHEALALEPEFMQWKPLETEGRYLLADMFGEHSSWQRMVHRMKYLAF